MVASSGTDIIANGLAAQLHVDNAEAANDHLVLALGATREATEIAKGRGLRAARLNAIKADITENFARADLSVVEIAAKHQVTARYVQMLFEEDGTTFTEFLTGQRLARAHRLLCEPANQTAISNIAYDVGFGDLSYFNRRFRRQFGLTPREVRGDKA